MNKKLWIIAAVIVCVAAFAISFADYAMGYAGMVEVYDGEIIGLSNYSTIINRCYEANIRTNTGNYYTDRMDSKSFVRHDVGDKVAVKVVHWKTAITHQEWRYVVFEY